MTIGLAVFGPNAGLAAWRALAAVEAVGRGAIGGFVTFAAIDADGTLHRAETQRGGSRTLFTAGETTGVAPPEPIASARIAALISSGPDRPAPLSQFVPGDPAVGLVTGHRLPNMAGVDGTPLNQAVFERMRQGATPQEAIDAELTRNPEADAGLIAISPSGELGIANSAFVQQRGDFGQRLARDGDTGMGVAVLHNAIHPHPPLAHLATAVALDSMAPADRADFEIFATAGIELRQGDENCLHIDGGDEVRAVTVTQESWLAGYREGAAINYAAAVRRDGVLVGRTTTEPYCVTRDGRVVSWSGQPRVRLGIRLVSRET